MKLHTVIAGAAFLAVFPLVHAEQKDPSMDKTGSTIHGFKLTRIEHVKEADSTARLFEHVKSGARLLYLSNKDDNKVFSIAFRTLPENDTGIPHILEHSVLNGSRKFPSKEPFVELIKGSVNTFVNAMTYPDKTVYPVASRNAKDFRNLMDVYLDAVFYPRLKTTPEILQQEGWHYEVDPKTGELSYNGVVYNEMKGVYSSPDALLGRESFRSLFPDTIYSNDSGGDPHTIPQLTQEEFIKFHDRFYHPTNAYIFMYGDSDVAEQLKFINEEYLANFTKKKIDAKIKKQKAFSKPKEITDEYPINNGDPSKNKTYFTLNYAVGEATDTENVLGMDILETILLETPASPLKRALLNAGVGQSVDGGWETDLMQPSFTIQVKGSDPEMKEKFTATVEQTLKQLVAKGIDKKLIEAAVNRTEFLLREFEVRGYPKGIVYNFKTLESWLYDGDPLTHLRFEPALAKIKRAAGKKYFEKLIARNLLKNKHRTLIMLKPKAGLDQQRNDALKTELTKLKTKFSKQELADIETKAKKLKERQNTPDSAEDLAKIPLLEIKDLDRQAEVLPLAEHSIDGVTTLHHDVFTNRINYMNLFFDTSEVTEKQLPYLAFLSSVIGKIGTEKYSFETLSNEMNIHTGGLSFAHLTIGDKTNNAIMNPRFVVKAKALPDKLGKTSELIQEILLKTKFTDRKRLKELLQESKSAYEMSITNSGMGYAVVRAGSYFSPLGKYNELTGGISYYRFLLDLERNFDKRADEIATELSTVAKQVFKRSNVLVSFTADNEGFNAAKPTIKALLTSIPAANATKTNYAFTLSHDNEGLIIPSKVQFVVQGANYRKLGFDYSGKMQVLANLMRTDFLWNRIRVQGGAYGARIDINRNGTMMLSSYRDPNLKRTLEAYSAIADYLDNLELPERELQKFIIGTISNLDQPLTPSQKGERSAMNYISGLTQQEIQQTRDEVLATSLKDLRSYSKLFSKAIEQNYVCVLGSEAKIKEDKDALRKLVNVFE